jgi:hypothetical protein
MTLKYSIPFSSFILSRVGFTLQEYIRGFSGFNEGVYLNPLRYYTQQM